MLGWLADKHLGQAARASRPGEPSGNPPGGPFVGPAAESSTEPVVESSAGSSFEWSAGSPVEASVEPSREPGIGTFDMTAESGTAAGVPVGIADVDFAPEGKPDAKRYNDVWGSPDDDRVKCLEATHWFEVVGEVPAVTPEHVHAYFIEKGWEVPDDLMDAIARAGVKGYLRTEDPTDLRVAPDGQRLMESSLSYVDP